jgi:hypothetical protein
VTQPGFGLLATPRKIGRDEEKGAGQISIQSKTSFSSQGRICELRAATPARAAREQVKIGSWEELDLIGD